MMVYKNIKYFFKITMLSFPLMAFDPADTFFNFLPNLDKNSTTNIVPEVIPKKFKEEKSSEIYKTPKFPSPSSAKIAEDSKIKKGLKSFFTPDNTNLEKTFMMTPDGIEYMLGLDALGKKLPQGGGKVEIKTLGDASIKTNIINGLSSLPMPKQFIKDPINDVANPIGGQLQSAVPTSIGASLTSSDYDLNPSLKVFNDEDFIGDPYKTLETPVFDTLQ